MCAKDLWFSVCKYLQTEDSTREFIWRVLERKYSEEHRYYHTMEHLDNMANEVMLLGNIKVEQVLALLFHDAIYFPDKEGSEDKSAALAESVRKKLGLGWMTGYMTNQMIIATKTHTIDASLSLELQGLIATFLDLDLCILGSHESVYDSYAKNVRKEYSFVPFSQFQNGRVAFITNFIARKNIYFTSYFIKKYEVLARLNLARELESLLMERS